MKKLARRSGLLSLALLIALSSLAAAFASDTSYDAKASAPVEIALVIGGRDITNGRGFLKNVAYFTQDELDELRDQGSGVTTYKYGLGDSWLASSRIYSTYEMHGEPVWAYRRVSGIDVEAMAKALGVDTSREVPVTATASDGFSYTLEDAFNFTSKRYYINPQGVVSEEVSPVLALYETISKADSPPAAGSTHKIPDAPVIGAESPDAAEPIFGFGQTDVNEENNCHWVKFASKLRLGSEDAALRVTNASGRNVSSSLSSIILGGLYTKSFTYENGIYDAVGQPLMVLLDGMGVTVSPRQAVVVTSEDGSFTLPHDELDGCFAAWDASSSGTAVKNPTALMLFTPDGAIGGLTSLKVENGPEQQDAFTDLDGFEWAKSAVSYLFEQGVVTGYEGKYHPEDNIKRGDFILMLARAYGLSAHTHDNFADVPEGSYYYDAIAAARALGIALGDGAKFGPEEPISRQDAMTLLYRTLGVCGVSVEAKDSLSAFEDAGSISDYALEPISALVGAGIINGSGGSINPRAFITRAEMAQALYKALILL